jgi:hypothetical protein
MKFWLSWYQPTQDYRPLTYPPNEAIAGWWCSGFASEGHTICAAVVADSEEAAKAAVNADWPEAENWRFCEEREKFEFNDRWQIDTEWSKPRLDAANAST